MSEWRDIGSAPKDGTGGQVLRPTDWCVFCLAELARGVPEDGICGHEELLKQYASPRQH